VGGTYFIQNPNGEQVAVFKPSDEEPGAEYNPKKLTKKPILPPGGGSIRELAAYELDRDHLAGVPETYILSNVRHKSFASSNEKHGSLQRFIENEGDSSSYGSSLWSVEDVHHIGVLDIRLFNMDRNEENMLVQRQDNGRLRLIPIDHTYCLPPVSSLDSCSFVWHYWSQAKQRFSQETLDYIDSIDISHDVTVLRSLGLNEDSIKTMVVMTMLLKEASAAGWTLHDIACLVTRSIPSTPSRFEVLVASSRIAATKNLLPYLDVYANGLQALVQSKISHLR